MMGLQGLERCLAIVMTSELGVLLLFIVLGCTMLA